MNNIKIIFFILTLIRNHRNYKEKYKPKCVRKAIKPKESKKAVYNETYNLKQYVLKDSILIGELSLSNEY